MFLQLVAVLDDEACQRVRETFKRVVRFGGTERAAAERMDVPQPRWDEMTKGDRPLCIHKLASFLPEELKEFCVEWLRVYGLPKRLETTQPVIAAIQRLDGEDASIARMAMRKREIA